MAKRAYRVVVSFESETAPVDTYRGEIVAAGASTAARRALTTALAQRPNPRQHWRSLVVVLEKAEGPR